MEQFDENFSFEMKNVAFIKCTPSWSIVKETHNMCNLTYVTKGGARYTINGKNYDLNEGDLLCLPRGSIRAATTYKERPMQCYSVDFLLKNAMGSKIQLPFSVVSPVGRGPYVSHLFKELCSSWQDVQPGHLIKCRGTFLLILHRFYEAIVYGIKTESTDARIRRVSRYIQANYGSKITAKKMAELAGLCPAYLGTLFKQETGISFNNFLTRTRVRNAEHLLLGGGFTVEEAAEACGFSDKIHFYKCFKQVLGFSPAQCKPRRE